MATLRDRIPAAVVVLVLLAVVLTGGLVGRAQEAASPETTPRPAHIHAGTCESLNPDVLYPLNDVIFRGTAVGTPQASPVASPAGAAGSPAAGVSPLSGIPAAVGVTVLDVPLADLLGGQRAINVHESAENLPNYIACGTIVGAQDATGGVYIGLAEQNGSGFSGTAWLQATSETQTTVTVFLAEGLATALPGASPAATPAV
ncbi:MAG: hypothetical protein AVDCRST_MAG49-30 [uncultured Thermomicrobiales bacterium]|uniref:CHRD domain-containing protein n=1 Tax=uncultured Thermomicrobiales bacterium TaxID=1645740 RepID=A0A6J4TV39_9BACT|nr:MAG: hypothetical protein AVDCRST_MAG49-30 [uncultured Thermomicrobiales bacterium]